jgi:hypothetical protein
MSDVFPSGWKKTLSELGAELPGRVPTAEEWGWARAYERAELRKWARFPLNGEVFEATQDTPVRYLTHWRAPFTDGGSGVLPAGTRFRVLVMEGDPEPIGVHADPLESERIEELLVPSSVRTEPKYAGYSLSIGTDELNRLYKLVPAHVA